MTQNTIETDLMSLIQAGDALYRLVRYHAIDSVRSDERAERIDALRNWTQAKTALTTRMILCPASVSRLQSAQNAGSRSSRSKVKRGSSGAPVAGRRGSTTRRRASPRTPIGADGAAGPQADGTKCYSAQRAT
jgi:hypothetical protein